jgi:hypothetical protein
MQRFALRTASLAVIKFDASDNNLAGAGERNAGGGQFHDFQQTEDKP